MEEIVRQIVDKPGWPTSERLRRMEKLSDTQPIVPMYPAIRLNSKLTAPAHSGVVDEQGENLLCVSLLQVR